MNVKTSASVSFPICAIIAIIACAVAVVSLLAFQLPDKERLDIRGSWYFDEGNGGDFDSLVNYTEAYVGDSLIEFFNERGGQYSPRRYVLTTDSILIGHGRGRLRSICKIIGLIGDTLRLNPRFVSKNGLFETFWVRLPSGEKGAYDHTWTNENRDSLKIAIGEDWNRRRWKYHCQRVHRMDYFDSLTRAGTWKWTMKEVREAEEREKEYIRTHY
jgi:hypothetical protein